MANVEKVIEFLEDDKNYLFQMAENQNYSDADRRKADDLYCDIKEAIQTIRELQNQIPKWHLCSEELPDEATTYICAVRHRFNRKDRWRWTVTSLILFGTENEWLVNEDKDEVIAWMELPKFESEEEDGVN